MLQGDKMPDFSDSCNNILKYGGIADADIAKISSKINQFQNMPNFCNEMNFIDIISYCQIQIYYCQLISSSAVPFFPE